MSRGRKLIVAIGIDHYQRAAWRLTNAVNDANASLRTFQALGFDLAHKAILDDNATRDALHRLVADELSYLDEEDSLIIFFAGHGRTLEHTPAGKQVTTGYILPVDATEKPSSWIDLHAWLDGIALLPPLHILVMLDACHSGIALDPVTKWRDIETWKSTPRDVLSVRSSRRIITSAQKEQVASDGGSREGHSLFTSCLLDALTNPQIWPTREISGSALALHLRDRVSSHPDSRQTPDFGTFARDERGELIIDIPNDLDLDAPVCRATTARPCIGRLRARKLRAMSFLRRIRSQHRGFVVISILACVFAAVWIFQIQPSQSELRRGTVILTDGWRRADRSVFHFMTAYVGRWNVDPSDIGVSSQGDKKEPWFFLPYNADPYRDPPGRALPSHSGIFPMQASSFDAVTECPRSEYLHHFVQPTLGGIYCVQIQGGQHYAKLHVTGIDSISGTIRFDWILQPNGSRQFENERMAGCSRQP